MFTHCRQFLRKYGFVDETPDGRCAELNAPEAAS